MQFRLPKQSYESLRTLLDLGPERIDHLAEALSATAPGLVEAELRAIQIYERLGGDEQIPKLAEIIAWVVYPSYGAMYQSRVDPGEFYTLLTDSLMSAKEELWPARYSVLWSNYRAQLIKLLSNPKLAQEAKARDLLETRPNLVRKISIFSDVRPVFSDDGADLYFDILTNTLCIEFKSNNQNATMFFSLDSKDLDDLESQISRAKVKARTVGSIHQKFQLPLIKVEGGDAESPSHEGQ